MTVCCSRVRDWLAIFSYLVKSLLVPVPLGGVDYHHQAVEKNMNLKIITYTIYFDGSYFIKYLVYFEKEMMY